MSGGRVSMRQYDGKVVVRGLKDFQMTFSLWFPSPHGFGLQGYTSSRWIQRIMKESIHRCLFFALDDFALLGAASGRPSVVAGETVWRGMSFLPAVVMEDSFFPNVRCRVVIVGRRTV